VASAAADDRNSYGCATGNAYTDFGRALFGQLRRTRSFEAALAAATDEIARAEARDGRRASLPRVSKGAAIGAKLAELEARLERGDGGPRGDSD
jgi:hypothetical protein